MKRDFDFFKEKNIFKLWCAIMIMIFVAYIQPYRLTVIDSAEIGIKFHKWSTNENQKGGVEGTCKGWIIFNRYTTDIFRYPTYIQRKSYDPFIVTAKDASIFTMDPQIAYRIDESKVCDIFVKYRKKIEDLENGYIRTCIYEAYRTCANKYASEYLMSNRAEFESDVRQRLEKSLLNEGFIVEEFTSAITPPESLARMINEKNAKIKIAEAHGDAEALKIAADAEAYANTKIANSINETLIKKMWVEKWNGVMPKTTTGTNTMMMIGNDK